MNDFTERSWAAVRVSGAGKGLILLVLTGVHLWGMALEARAEEPFAVSVKASPTSVHPGDRITVESHIGIAAGCYMYKSEAGLALHEQAGFRFTADPLPAARLKKDPTQNKDVEIYEGSVALRGGVDVDRTVKPGQYVLAFETRFQGCTSETCYLPDSKVEKVRIQVLSGVSTRPLAAAPPPSEAAPAGESDFASILKRGFLWALGVSFLAGLYLSLTPCIYPLLPITVGVIGATSLGRPARGFVLSVSYVFGISITYALLGTVAAWTGQLFGSLVQSPWVLGFVAAVFFALSLSMFGVFELPMLSGLSERYQGRTGAGLVGVFVMGIIAGLVASPCVGPVILGLLVYVSTTGNLVLGFLMLFVTGWGMGLPLIVLGTFSGAVSLLPRPGGWMVLVRQVFGLMMLGAGFYYLKGVLPWPAYLSAMGVVLLVLGVFAGALDQLTSESGALARIYKSFGLLCLVVGVCAVAAVALPRFGFEVSTGAGRTAGAGGPAISWVSSEQEALAKAKAAGRPVMIDFWAEWCAVCKELESSTLADPEVVRQAQRFVAVRVDCTRKSDPEVKEVLKRYGVLGLPTIIFIDSKGRRVMDKTVNKYVSSADFLSIMRTVE